MIRHLFKKDSFHVRYLLLVWYATLFAAAVAFALDRAEPVQVMLFPVTALVVLAMMPMVFEDEPVDPQHEAAYWVTRPLDRFTILRAKWLFVSVHFILLPFVVFLCVYLARGFPVQNAVGAAGLKALHFGTLASLPALMAWIADGWKRFAPMLMASIVIIIVGAAWISGGFERSPLLSPALILGSFILSAFLASIVHVISRNYVMPFLALFGVFFLINGNAIYTASEVAKKDFSYSPLRKSRRPLYTAIARANAHSEMDVSPTIREWIEDGIRVEDPSTVDPFDGLEVPFSSKFEHFVKEFGYQIVGSLPAITSQIEVLDFGFIRFTTVLEDELRRRSLEVPWRKEIHPALDAYYHMVRPHLTGEHDRTLSLPWLPGPNYQLVCLSETGGFCYFPHPIWEFDSPMPPDLTEARGTVSLRFTNDTGDIDSLPKDTRIYILYKTSDDPDREKELRKLHRITNTQNGE